MISSLRARISAPAWESRARWARAAGCLPAAASRRRAAWAQLCSWRAVSNQNRHCWLPSPRTSRPRTVTDPTRVCVSRASEPGSERRSRSASAVQRPVGRSSHNARLPLWTSPVCADRPCGDRELTGVSVPFLRTPPRRTVGRQAARVVTSLPDALAIATLLTQRGDLATAQSSRSADASGQS